MPRLRRLPPENCRPRCEERNRPLNAIAGSATQPPSGDVPDEYSRFKFKCFPFALPRGGTEAGCCIGHLVIAGLVLLGMPPRRPALCAFASEGAPAMTCLDCIARRHRGRFVLVSPSELAAMLDRLLDARPSPAKLFPKVSSKTGQRARRAAASPTERSGVGRGEKSG